LYENHFIVHYKWLSWLPFFTRKLVVSKDSAGRYFGAAKQLPNTDHFSSCKPREKAAVVHQYLYDFVLENGLLPIVSGASSLRHTPNKTDEVIQRYATPSGLNNAAKPTSKKGYRVIGFDLDGTLLRGIDFSWTVVWKYLGFPEAVYKGAMHDYRKGTITYQEWCDLACKNFRSKGLSRKDFPEIVKDISVTKNLKETLDILRNAGFVIALISGGIDTFIEEKIPNAGELFDYICINRLQYEQPNGMICGVDATPYDFEGKTVALEAICKRHGCSLKEAVFVGEGFNDEDVVNRAGLSIAYPPGETAIDAASIGVTEDDLLEILKHVH